MNVFGAFVSSCAESVRGCDPNVIRKIESTSAPARCHEVRGLAISFIGQHRGEGMYLDRRTPCQDMSFDPYGLWPVTGRFTKTGEGSSNIFIVCPLCLFVANPLPVF